MALSYNKNVVLIYDHVTSCFFTGKTQSVKKTTEYV